MSNSSGPKQVRLREARAEDVRQYFEWVVDPRVRANSLLQEEITWEGHQKWFSAKLGDPSVRLFVLEDAERPLAQVRFELRDEGWVIHYSVDASARGRGLGKQVLEQGIDALKDTGHFGRLFAIVRKENIPSLRVFRSLGFTENDAEDGISQFVMTISSLSPVE